MGHSRSNEVEYWDFDLFFSYFYSVKTALTLNIVKQITTQIIGRGQKEGKSGKKCQDNFSFLFFFLKIWLSYWYMFKQPFLVFGKQINEFKIQWVLSYSIVSYRKAYRKGSTQVGGFFKDFTGFRSNFITET